MVRLFRGAFHGFNLYGNLGIGSIVTVSEPARVLVSDDECVVDIRRLVYNSGMADIYALLIFTQSGKIFACGQNADNDSPVGTSYLGVGHSEQTVPTPTCILTLNADERVTEIKAWTYCGRYEHYERWFTHITYHPPSIGVRVQTTHRTFAWGNNASGELNFGHDNPVMSPTPVPTREATSAPLRLSRQEDPAVGMKPQGVFHP